MICVVSLVWYLRIPTVELLAMGGGGGKRFYDEPKNRHIRLPGIWGEVFQKKTHATNRCVGRQEQGLSDDIFYLNNKRVCDYDKCSRVEA